MDSDVFARASVNIWDPLSGERAAWLNNSLTLVSFKRNLKKNSLLGTVLELSSATFSSKVYHCILLVSLYVIHVILFVWYVYYIGLLERFRVQYYKALFKYCILLLLIAIIVIIVL